MENNDNKVILNGEPREEAPKTASATESQTPPVNSQGAYNPNYNTAPVRPCPVCGTEYTYVCPKCGFSPYVGNKKAKTGIFSKWWFWLISVAVAFAIIIGAASCAIFLSSSDSSVTSSYDSQPLCIVGDIQVELVEDQSYREDYEIILTIEVENKGKEDVSFYPTKALLDGEKAMAYGDFSYEDDEIMWDYDSYYADDGSIIIKSGKSHLVELRFNFDNLYDYEENETDDSSTPLADLRKKNTLEFSLNTADPETCSVIDSHSIKYDLTKIRATKKYYEYE